LTEAELGIARSTEPEALAELDEDGLLELHDRVRRARKKYSGSIAAEPRPGSRTSAAGARPTPCDASDIAIGRRNQARRDSR
jgi:hypothetical protein